ncbi:MAG: GDP-mannose 4,6-dehydratase [Thermoflexales bacterium]|nr:GDP-mannose 4,6-dehydratase [Thermoflexales bacterium]MCS7324401.1 GDP-mannose 4,6-dehydratase [Thermoflexales bacterium]MCX7938317.1 GDP-mannose 4,6-dehydratase [Thermoflexales bacterium]MDW8053274.1 GDP-mannose 4,6-dehydratase [Anaerolineae bacterium]MDW8291925.1 GDP-mannose 4,6-dehydratase [Anaerolineae bacterium]
MRVLITGMAGFVGQHLARLLIEETHWTLIGVSRDATGDRQHPRVLWWQLDLRDSDAVNRLLRYERPDIIVHLAAQAHVPTAWKDPWGTYENNLKATVNLFEAIVANQLAPRVLLVSSNEVYGRPESEADLPFTESRPPQPTNPYAVSKAAQELIALQYRRSHGLDVVIARPFNHIGPGQDARFVAADFARQIAEIEAGLRAPVMLLGNMAAQRDFTDVRDVVRAYLALIRLGDPGVAYNVCSGQPRSIQALLDALLALTSVKIEQRTDPSKFRAADTPISYGDPTRIREATGWLPRIPFEQTLADVLNDWRARVKQSLP